MLEKVDIRFVGIISIVIVLAMGYFVYVMYQDVACLKKDVEELQYSLTDDDLKDSDEITDLEMDDISRHVHFQDDLDTFEKQIEQFISTDLKPEIYELEIEGTKEENESPQVEIIENEVNKVNEVNEIEQVPEFEIPAPIKKIRKRKNTKVNQEDDY